MATKNGIQRLKREFQRSSATADRTEAHATFSYLVDSEGKLHERQFIAKADQLEMSLEQLNTMAKLMMFVDSATYSPSETNQARVPVRATSKMYLLPIDGCTRLEVPSRDDV